MLWCILLYYRCNIFLFLCTMLCYTSFVLYCTLCCTIVVFYFIVLYCTCKVLLWIVSVSFWIELCCTVLLCVVQCCAPYFLYFSLLFVLYCAALFCVVQHIFCTLLFVLYCAVLHCVVLKWIVLNFVRCNNVYCFCYILFFIL